MLEAVNRGMAGGDSFKELVNRISGERASIRRAIEP
jgi:hypothetical protein